MKKTLIIISLIFLGFTPHVLAAATEGFTALAPIPGLTQGVTSVVDQNTLSTFFNNLYKYLIGLAAIIAVIQIIWAGLDIAFFHKDAVATIVDDKGKIYNAIFGLVLVLAPYLVFSIINPSILNLSIGMPEIKTAVTSTPSGGGRSVDTTTGCSVTGTAGILLFATCPSEDAARTWGQQSCSGGVLSAITPITRNTDGTMATCRISCMQSNVFDFIDVSTSLRTNAIDSLQPVAITNLISNNPNNGASAVQFANICQSAGLKTCISDRPTFTRSHTCSPLPTGTLPAGAPSPAKCYKETLSCEDISFFNANKDMCASSPSWTPFQ